MRGYRGKPLNIAIFGLGYVGTVSAACFARDGHHVTGVDINPDKVADIQKGKSPIIEPGLAELIQAGINSGRLKATADLDQAIQENDLAMICVGTPSQKNGDLDLTYVKNVCRSIGQSLKNKASFTTIIIRSTVLPGTATKHILPLLEANSGKRAGSDFGFCINPEFLREGSAIRDFDAPPFTVIGEIDGRSGTVVAELYGAIDAPTYRVPLGPAEMIKYASNAFHALKIVFANEIGNLCQIYGIDSHQVMEIFVQDTKLNLSPAYLKPGFAFGGSCLPKDLRAMLYAARQADVEMPVMEAILPSNAKQAQKAFTLIEESGKRKVGLIGLSFKPNTDDLRESPAAALAERLIGKGYELAIYDHEVSLSRLLGSNRNYIEEVIPHISSLMQPSMEDTITQAEAVVVAKQLSVDEYDKLINLLQPDQVLIDLVRINGQALPDFEGNYYGISW